LIVLPPIESRDDLNKFINREEITDYTVVDYINKERFHFKSFDKMCEFVNDLFNN
jgi:hypothetical protein